MKTRRSVRVRASRLAGIRIAWGFPHAPQRRFLLMSVVAGQLRILLRLPLNGNGYRNNRLAPLTVGPIAGRSRSSWPLAICRFGALRLVTARGLEPCQGYANSPIAGPRSSNASHTVCRASPHCWKGMVVPDGLAGKSRQFWVMSRAPSTKVPMAAR